MSINPVVSLATNVVYNDRNFSFALNFKLFEVDPFFFFKKKIQVLRELPLSTPNDLHPEDDNQVPIKLFDNQQQYEAATKILNSADSNLIERTINALLQFDSSKM